MGSGYIFEPDLQIINDSIQNLNGSNFLCNLDSSLNTLFVVSPIQSHSMIPKCFKEWRQDIFLYIDRVNTISTTTLLDHFEYNLFHFFIWRSKFANQNQHDFSCIVICIFCIHQRDNISDSFQESGQALSSVGSDTFP